MGNINDRLPCGEFPCPNCLQCRTHNADEHRRLRAAAALHAPLAAGGIIGVLLGVGALGALPEPPADMTSGGEDGRRRIHRFFDIAGEPQKVFPPISSYAEMPLVSLEAAIEPLVTLVPEIRNMVYVVKSNCQNSDDGLPCDEFFSIMLYSLEWDPPENSFYLILNATLRAEDRLKLRPWYLFLRLIVTALSKLPSERCLVYRGIKLDLSKEYPEGKTFLWWGFSSCTCSLRVLENENFLGNTGVRTLFNIECFSGKDIRRHSLYPKEDEILLLPARQFKVLSCLGSNDGLHIIHLKEIVPPFDFLTPVCTTSPLSIPPPTYTNPKLQEIIASFPSNSTIDLSRKQVTDRDIEIVVKEAIINKQCKYLWLQFNEISNLAASTLSDALYNNTTLKGLFLRDNRLFDAGVRSLVLSINSSALEILGLGSNGITDEGAEHLSELLRTNRTLSALALENNNISDRGVGLLANVLAHHNTTLSHLYLSANKSVSDSSIECLVIMLKKNQSLKGLWIGGCNLSALGKTRLQEVTDSKNNFELTVTVSLFGQ